MLTGLAPATTYYYVVGNDNDGWSTEKSFTTIAPNATTLRIGVWGDIGQTDNSSATFNALAARNPQVIINTADFTYSGKGLCALSTAPQFL